MAGFERIRRRFLTAIGVHAKIRGVAYDQNSYQFFNKPHDYILAIIQIDGEMATPRYIRWPFQREPDFGVTSVNYDLDDLLRRAEEPA